ncbi:TPA: DUF2623 family protein [Serratia marcescens]|nr:DUF2623 family protein [Serratia marcescens]
MSQPRTSGYPIDAQFIERWSPRAMANDTIDDQTLLSFFEAARWSPSAYNIQPWRFAYSKHGSDSWENYLEFLIDFNRGWAQHASALVVIVSKTTSLNGERLMDNPTHAFEAGQLSRAYGLGSEPMSEFFSGGDSRLAEKFFRAGYNRPTQG